MTDLRKLSLNTKDAVVTFPGHPDFKVTVSFISRTTAKNILQKSEKPEFKNGLVIGTVRDEELFATLFASAGIKGWTGLTLDIASSLLLLDTTGQDLNAPVEYSTDNAFMLVKNSPIFAQFIDTCVYDLENFR